MKKNSFVGGNALLIRDIKEKSLRSAQTGMSFSQLTTLYNLGQASQTKGHNGSRVSVFNVCTCTQKLTISIKAW